MEQKYHNVLMGSFKNIINENDIFELEKNILAIYNTEDIPNVIYRLLDLKNAKNQTRESMLKNINTIIEDNIYDTDVYNIEKNELKMRDEFISNPFTVEEGVMQCNKCGSKKTYSQSKQVRSADEGFTTFCMCSNCGAKWRIN